MKQMLAELRVRAQKINRPLRLMEVCGTHTVEIFRHGVRSVIPSSITLLSGPGCPVCVTPIRDVDTAIAIAKQPGVVLTTFGDMMRVPGGKAGPERGPVRGRGRSWSTVSRSCRRRCAIRWTG